MKLKDNKIYRWIVIPLCILLCLFGKYIPTGNAISQNAMGVLMIFLGSLILWLTIGIDWPSLLCIFSLGLLDDKSLGFTNVFKNSFGNSTFMFLVFTFICTYALSKTGLIKRVAIFFINLKIAKKNAYWFIVCFLTGVLLLGLFISPSVLFVIILPILEKVFELANINKEEKIAKALMLGLGFTVSISSGMTPIAHVFPLLAMNAAGLELSPILYMGMAIPSGLILFILMLVMFRLFIKVDKNRFKDVDINSLKEGIQKVSKKDIITLVTFIIVILLWIIPSLFKSSLPDFYNFINKYGTAMPPLLGVLILSIVRVDDKPIINVGDAFKNGVPWGSLMMCAATLVLGVALTSDSIGIKTFIQTSLGSSLKNVSMTLLIFIFVTWAALQTNLSSNMVTATLVASVAASIISFTSGSANTLAPLAAVIGMIASFAFATPPSMPHIAIVASSEYCNTKDVLIFGGILMILSIVVGCLVAYPLGFLLFNL